MRINTENNVQKNIDIQMYYGNENMDGNDLKLKTGIVFFMQKYILILG